MLFMDLLKPFAPDTISRLLGEKSSKHLGWKMKIKAYRQMTIGFRRQNKIEGIECDIQEDTMRLIYAQQSGHSVSTENRTYGLSPDLVEGLADATIELYLNSSSDWQRLLKVVPGDTTLPYKQCLVENYAKLAADGFIMAHTPTKSTHTDITPLAKLMIELKSESGASHNILMGEIKRLQADIQALKHDIHHQSLPSATLITTPATLAMPQSPAAIHATRSPPARLNLVNVSPLPPLKRPHPTDSIVTSDPPSKKAMLQKRLGDMVDHLSLLVGKETTWRNLDQRSAVACLMTLKRDAIIVLRTGLGKTAIALLPAMVEDCVTVVVVPLIILFEEWESRLQKARIPFDTFAHDRTTPINTGAKVVLVSSDTARFASWKEAIAKLHDIRPVVRMVIDEAHYYFTDLDFRSNALGNPFSLRTLPFQIVLLSATIPPAAEAHLKTEFGLHIPHIIRGLSHRKELKYRILEGGENIEAMVEQFTLYCDQLQEEQQWSDGDRWIVFVPWVAEGYYVADLLGVEFYHADSDAFPITREERSEMYGRFTRGEKKGLVASTALGAGTDYPHIRLTCHLGAMYGMVNFVQQSSRAGRDGKSAHCIVIPNKVPPNSPNREIADLTGVSAMQELVYIQQHDDPQKICIRRQIGKTMDGVSYCCFDFDATFELCGVCEQGASYTDAHQVLYISNCETVAGVDSDYFTEDAMRRMDIPAPLTSFPVPSLSTVSAIRKDMWETFGEAVEEAAHRTGMVLAEKASQLQGYKRVLDAVGTSCGVCWTKGKVSSHNADSCPHIICNKRGYWAFKKKIRYVPRGYKSSPCWKCHICSMGENYLHKDYTKGTGANCDHPNLLPGLLYYLWTEEDLRKQLQDKIGCEWNGIEAWAAWLGEKSEEHSTHAMEILLWFGNQYVSM